jgi:hypothetical protein
MHSHDRSEFHAREPTAVVAGARRAPQPNGTRCFCASAKSAISRVADGAFAGCRAQPVAGAGYRANTQFKTRHVLRKLHYCPWRAGQLAKAIHVLQVREANAG